MNVHYILEYSIYLCAGGAVVALFLLNLAGQRHRKSGPSDQSLSFFFPIFQKYLHQLARWNRQFPLTAYFSYLSRTLQSAGRPFHLTPLTFLAIQEASGFLLLLFSFFLPSVKGIDYVFSSVVALGLGCAAPLLWLQHLQLARHKKIFRDLPYIIDLLTLAVEAGLDFTTAIKKVVEKGKAGPLKNELAVMLQEVQMGKTRKEALQGMAKRVRLPSLTTFISSLIQADQMGTGLAQVLRVQAEQLRSERTLTAERLAHLAPVKLLFPLIFFVFPNVFFILFFPILFQIFSQ